VKPALAYRPGRSPLHRARPLASVAFLGSFVLVAAIYPSPLVLVAVGVAVSLVGLECGAGRAVAASLRIALPLFLFMVLVNALVSHRGDTVLVRGWEMPVLGNTDITLESLAEGAKIGLLTVVVIIAFAVYSACVDPDRVLRALRPVAKRSAMTAGLVTRMVPLALSDGARLGEAAALRGPGAERVGRPALARRVIEGSLDRAVDVAATLELRGHALPIRPQQRRERSLDDAPLLWAAAAIAAVALAARIAGAGGFDSYPTMELDAGRLTLIVCAALFTLGAIPFALRRWRSRG
jgi:energy-coupling factor transport system permease protein